MKLRMRVRNARRKKEMTLEQLAHAVTGISISALSRFETGKTQLRKIEVDQLLAAIANFKGTKTYERKAGTPKD